VETGGLEVLSKLLQQRTRLARVTFQPDETIHREHPESDRLHMESGDSAAERLGLFHQLIADLAGRQRGELREESVERGE
jgi:hypothetical protein